jgi:CheY-like chemotaxis protein
MEHTPSSSPATTQTSTTPERQTLPGAAPSPSLEGERHGDVRGAEEARLRALGVLATGFAEEIEQELAHLDRQFEEQRELIERLRDRPAAPAPGQDPASLLLLRTADCWAALKRSRKAVRRFASVIEPGAPERLDLTLVAADALTLVAPRLRSLRVTVRLQASKGHFVTGRRGDLLRLFVHVLLGAAGGAGAEEGVSSERGRMVPRAFVLDVHRLQGHEIARLTDAGEIGAGARPSLFELPPELDEQGVDLAIAWQIVGAHEGHLEMAASGVPCNIVLPAASAVEALGSTSLGPRARLPGRRADAEPSRPVLLWIDADDLFLEIMVQTLHEYDVRVARSAGEGLQLLAFDVKPSLIFCNVKLPDRPGPELHAQLSRQSPEIGQRFVFVTDGVLTPEVASYLIGSGRPIVMRPIDLAQVRAMASPAPAPRPASATSPSPVMARARIEDRETPEAPPPRVEHDPRRAPTEPAIPAVRLPAHLSQVLPVDHEGAPSTLPTTSISRCSPPMSARDAAPVSARDAAPVSARDAAPVSARDAAQVSARGAALVSTREQELAALARVVADTLRRGGPKKGATMVAMLKGRGLDESEALSVLTFGLSAGVIARDPPPSSLIRAPIERRSVLVVDDDFDLRQALRDVLEEQGYEVDTAENGAEALRKLRASKSPPVVLLDLMMPVMDGWEFLDQLEHDEALAGTPVVVVSASRSVGALPGVGEALSKPLDYYKLLTSIERSTLA